MDKHNKKKSDQLGMAHGTANNRLRKSIMFKLVQDLELNSCFHCNEKIKTLDEFSIEHKIAWLDSDDPIGLFFDLENISFSHLHCNVSNSRQPLAGKIISKHGSMNRYDKWGCRCNRCKKTKSKRNAKRIR